VLSLFRLKKYNSTHKCLLSSNLGRLLALRVAKGFDETNKKMKSKGSRGTMCIARRLMKFDGVFGPRLRRCVCESYFWFKIICFMFHNSK